MEVLHALLFSIPILVLFVFQSLLHQSRSKSAANRKTPPGPRGIPILGNLLQLGPSPHESLSHWAKVYGPLMCLRLGSVTTIVVSSPEMARELLQTNDKSFANRPVPDSVASQPNPEGTLAWVPGNHMWKIRRRMCSTQMFTAQSLDRLEHLRQEKVEQLVEHVRKHSEAGTAVDVGSLAFATSLNLISNTIFSVDIVGFDAAEEFKEVVWRIMEDAGRPNVSDYFPALKRLDVQRVRRHVRVSYMRLHQIFDRIISKRLQDYESDSRSRRHGDFLDVLLDNDFTPETMKPLILDLFIAGSDTTGSTTEWAMAELMCNPSAMEAAKREVVGGIRMRESEMEERLPYLQAVVKETLRLHPAAPLLLPYVAGDDVRTTTGYTIPKGSQLLVNAWSMGRNSEYWKDAALFWPERFLQGGSDMGKDYGGRHFDYIPFGAGRRICPGLPLANRMVTLMLASLLHSFHWKLPPDQPLPLDMSEQFGITLKKALPLYAIPLPAPPP